ncbi:sialin-like [Scaptodrosophila lebanonensis]|uniref:Sialin-like n=1 Tax=Drosophila lebanonensis TaxID=7225 RepID=A0A6J2UAM3_DROLE|nr:sialin-like [Scaptodrosophila lebanonensis]
MVRKSWNVPQNIILSAPESLAGASQIDIEHSQSDSSKLLRPPLWGSVRLTYSICAFISMTLHVAMRNMLGLVVLRMVHPRSEDELQLLSNATNRNVTARDALCESGSALNETDVQNIRTGDLVWTRAQELIFPGTFYYGYILALPLAGHLSDRMGGKLLFINSLTLQSLTYLALPPMAHLSFSAAVANLVVSGFLAGCGNPPLYQLFTVWAHPTERTSLLSFAYSGLTVGTMLIYPVANFLSRYGWETPFYVLGSISLCFGIACCWLIYNTLDDHPRLSAKEKAYLQSELAGRICPTSIPWRAVLTSIPVHAFVLTHAFNNYGYIMLALLMPRILHESMNFKLKDVGVLATAPYLGSLISKVVCIGLCSYAERHVRARLNSLRRYLFSICIIIAIGCISGIIYASCEQKILVVVLFVILGGVSDLGYNGGYWPTLLYFAPSFTGLILGLANCFAHICGAMAPYVVTAMVKTGTKSEWNTVLVTLIGAYGLAMIVFGTCGSSTLQSWDPRSQQKPNKTENKSKPKKDVFRII